MAFPFLSSTAQEILPFPENTIYEALIDYNSWSEWLPSIFSSRLLAKEDTLAIVELGFRVRGEKVSIMESIHTRNKAVLGRVIEGAVPIREISWDLEPAGSGRSKVTLTTRRKIAPALFTSAWRTALKPAACLARLRSWLASAQAAPELFEGAENLFELWETSTGFVCWIGGRKYKLTPLDDK